MAPPPGSRRHCLRVPSPVFDEAGESRSAEDPTEAAPRTAGEEPIFLRATAAAAGGRVAARAGDTLDRSPWAPATPERLRLTAKRLADRLAVGRPRLRKGGER